MGLRIQKIFGAQTYKFGHPFRETFDNCARIFAGRDAPNRIVASDQLRIDLKIDLPWIELTNGPGDLNSQPRRIEQIAIYDFKPHAFNSLALEVRIRGREAGRIDMDARNLPRIEICGELTAPDEIRADLLEGRIGSTADGIVLRIFQETHTRIERSGLEAAHVGRRVHPG